MLDFLYHIWKAEKATHTARLCALACSSLLFTERGGSGGLGRTLMPSSQGSRSGSDPREKLFWIPQWSLASATTTMTLCTWIPFYSQPHYQIAGPWYFVQLPHHLIGPASSQWGGKPVIRNVPLHVVYGTSHYGMLFHTKNIAKTLSLTLDLSLD